MWGAGTGAAFMAAVEEARALSANDNIVVVATDGIRNYLSAHRFAGRNDTFLGATSSMTSGCWITKSLRRSKTRRSLPGSMFTSPFLVYILF